MWTQSDPTQEEESDPVYNMLSKNMTCMKPSQSDLTLLCVSFSKKYL
jgi:hypothetical protein